MADVDNCMGIDSVRLWEVWDPITQPAASHGGFRVIGLID